jgi:hypothetical protein
MQAIAFLKEILSFNQAELRLKRVLPVSVHEGFWWDC